MAARDSRQAIKEAEASGSINKITVDEDVKKKLISDSKSSSVKMLIFSIILLVVAAAIVYFLATVLHIAIVGIKMFIIYIFILIFPFISIYSIISTFTSAAKGDYDFYSGKIAGKTEQGYQVQGLEDQNINFALPFKPGEDLPAGSDVRIFRLKGELSLF